jgi:hypothetical protein
LVRESGTTPNRCTYSVHLSVFSKSLEKLDQSRLVLDQSQEVLSDSVLSQKEHSTTSLKQEGLVREEKARLPSTRGMLTISGTMYHRLGGKE